MAAPAVTMTPNKATYLPTEQITVVTAVTDSDNSNEVILAKGHDSQGPVELRLEINRLDTFQWDSVVWERTGQPLTINGLTWSGVVPSMP